MIVGISEISTYIYFFLFISSELFKHKSRECCLKHIMKTDKTQKFLSKAKITEICNSDYNNSKLC